MNGTDKNDALWKELLQTIFETAESLDTNDEKFEEKILRELKRKYRIELWGKKKT